MSFSTFNMVCDACSLYVVLVCLFTDCGRILGTWDCGDKFGSRIQATSDRCTYPIWRTTARHKNPTTEGGACVGSTGNLEDIII